MANGKFETGPFLSAAFLCEKLLQEADGVKSAIRIVDRLTIQTAGPEPPTEMPETPYTVVLFVRFKSGRARGPMTLQVTLANPAGESKSIVNKPVMFEGEDDRGVDAICNMSMKLKHAGIYWFYVGLDGVNLTRVPFRVIYLREVTPPPHQGTGTP